MTNKPLPRAKPFALPIHSPFSQAGKARPLPHPAPFGKTAVPLGIRFEALNMAVELRRLADCPQESFSKRLAATL